MSLPPELRRALPPSTAKAWETVATLLPDGLYLVGGSAVAARLHHRKSRDLDFFCHGDQGRLPAFRAASERTGRFAVTHESDGTLRGLLGQTKLEAFDAGHGTPQAKLRPPTPIAGIPVASLPDLAAMKVKVIGDGGELRDYFDLKTLETQGAIPAETALVCYATRYHVDPDSTAFRHVVGALGYLDDVDADDALPQTRAEIVSWWGVTHRRVLRNLARN